MYSTSYERTMKLAFNRNNMLGVFDPDMPVHVGLALSFEIVRGFDYGSRDTFELVIVCLLACATPNRLRPIAVHESILAKISREA